jgi:hypothetical protein
MKRWPLFMPDFFPGVVAVDAAIQWAKLKKTNCRSGAAQAAEHQA